jgi:hypothetical protein
VFAYFYDVRQSIAYINILCYKIILQREGFMKTAIVLLLGLGVPMAAWAEQTIRVPSVQSGQFHPQFAAKGSIFIA